MISICTYNFIFLPNMWLMKKLDYTYMYYGKQIVFIITSSNLCSTCMHFLLIFYDMTKVSCCHVQYTTHSCISCRDVRPLLYNYIQLDCGAPKKMVIIIQDYGIIRILLHYHVLCVHTEFLM